jgi:hypothetical protein
MESDFGNLYAFFYISFFPLLHKEGEGGLQPFPLCKRGIKGDFILCKYARIIREN